MIDGMRIIESPLLTKLEFRTVRRSWRERLFSRPWHPLRATNLVPFQVPSDEVYRFGGALIMHPETARKLIAAVKAGKVPS